MYATGLHADAEPKLVSDEAPRALEPGGVLVLDGVRVVSLEADNPYFDPIKVECKVGDQEFANYAAVRNDVPYRPPQSGSQLS